MSDILKILEDLSSLEKHEIKLVLFKLMIDGKLSFKELSESYVNYLEDSDKKKNYAINKAGLWLVNYWHSSKKNDFTRAGTAYWLIKNSIVKGAKVEEEVTDYLEKHPYDEHANGFPITNEK